MGKKNTTFEYFILHKPPIFYFLSPQQSLPFRASQPVWHLPLLTLSFPPSDWRFVVAARAACSREYSLSLSALLSLNTCIMRRRERGALKGKGWEHTSTHHQVWSGIFRHQTCSPDLVTDKYCYWGRSSTVVSKVLPKVRLPMVVEVGRSFLA